MKFLSLLILLAFSGLGFSQLTVTEVTGETAADIICGPGVTPNTVSFYGQDEQIGSFSGGTSIFGIEAGIVLATGDITLADNPGNGGPAQYESIMGSGSESAPLYVEFNDPGHPMHDAAGLQISFVATSTELQFDFVFASEEYLEYVGEDYNDVIGVYIDGPGFTPDYAGFENVAIVPATDDFVSVNTVNPSSNSSWYNNNPTGGGAYPFAYDGFTDKMTVELEGLTCGENYRIHFAIADVGDEYYDAAIFVGSNSIQSSFDVGGLTIVGDPPYCEGEDIPVSVIGGSLTWDYDWSDGQVGTGLSTIDYTAVFGVDEVSVVVSDADGCEAVRSIPVEVHTSDNEPPILLNPVENLYVTMGDTICHEFFSTDYPNEHVYILINEPPHGYGTTASQDEFIGANIEHENTTLCYHPKNIFDYGAKHFEVVLTDDNACSNATSTYPFKINVLCAGCPDSLYIDNKHPDHYPFHDGTIDAARKLVIGSIDTVNTGDANVKFFAGEEIILGEFYESGTSVEINSQNADCIEQCMDCCTEESEFTYDAPAPITILTPNDDGIDDTFFISDLSSPYDAYHATHYHFTVWRYNELGYYAIANIVWQQNEAESSGYTLGWHFSCAVLETPTEMHPWRTFYWEGNHDDSGIMGAPGTSAGPGLYYYEVDLWGCKKSLHNQRQMRGHSTSFSAFIMVPDEMNPIANDSILDIVNNMEIEKNVSVQENQLSDELEITVYPNPTTDNLFVNLNNSKFETSTIILESMSGAKIVEEEFTGTYYMHSLGDLESGLYLVKIVNGKNEFKTKIILQH
jgi:hypothetical protein